MTKFNQGMYAKMRAKKNKPISNLGKKRLHVVEKGASVAPPAPVIEPTRTASPATSVEEITPLQKKQRVDDKGKDKADSHSSSVFDDASLALVRAQEAFTTKELRVFFCMSFNKVGGHIHKLVQVVYLCNFTLFFFLFLHRFEGGFSFQVLGESFHITSEHLTHEAKVVSTMSRVEALEADNSKLKKDLISAMVDANTINKKVKVLGDDLRAERQLTLEKDKQLQAAKEKIKTVAAKAVETFQQIEEYNTVLFNWYCKVFELLRWYLVKHPFGVDLENLDLEEVDQEMAADEAFQSTAPVGDAFGDAPLPPPDGDDTAAA